MKGHILSLVLFVLAVLVFLFIGIVGQSWLYGAVFGGIFLLVGLVLYRRGK